MKPLRGALLFGPFELYLSAALLAVAVAFLVSPETLDHAPIGFETRGIAHHLWHYSLLGGALLMQIGLLLKHPAAYRVGFVGLVVVWAALAENLIAVGSDDSATGIGLALRVATLVFLAVRGYVLMSPPVLHIPKQEG